MSALFRYNACSLCHWYELVQFTITRSVRNTHLWLVLLCTSLMFFKIPVCLYNSTMHLVHFFISLSMQHHNFWNFPLVFFSQRPKLSSPAPPIQYCTLFSLIPKQQVKGSRGGGVVVYSFQISLFNSSFKFARCMMCWPQLAWIGWWVNCAKFLFFSQVW